MDFRKHWSVVTCAPETITSIRGDEVYGLYRVQTDTKKVFVLEHIPSNTVFGMGQTYAELNRPRQPHLDYTKASEKIAEICDMDVYPQSDSKH